MIEAMDTGRTRPVRDGVKRWRWMVTCWEPRAFFRVQSKSDASDPGCEIEHPWYRRDTVADSLDRPSERPRATENSNKTFGGFRSSCESKNARRVRSDGS